MRGTWKTTDGGGSGGLALAVIAAAVLADSGAASAIGRALVVILITAGAVIALAICGIIAWLVHQARRERPGQAIAAPPARHLPAAAARPGLDAAAGRQVEADGCHLHIHLHGTDPAEVAALIRRTGD